MAPDLNSVPPSPRNPSTTPAVQQQQQQSSTTSSRRASQIFPMSPPPLPLASPGGTAASTHQSHQPFPPLHPVPTSSSASSTDMAAGVPVRHPRPLTAAELHLELEKEQEAVVNRLTRELSALRAHSASVASTTSSTSTAPGAFLDPADPTTSSFAGPTHPTPSRRHRSSSSVSRGSVSTGVGPNAAPLAPGATATLPYHHRVSASSATGPSDANAGGVRMSPSRSLSSSRYEEAALHRVELEEAKKENEMLRRRIRELEGLLRGRRRESSEVGREAGGTGNAGASEG